MYPVLFNFGDITIRSYGFFFAMAYVVAVIFGLKRAKKFNISKDDVWDMAFYIMIFSLLGAKLLSIIVDFKYIIQNGLSFSILRSGFVFLGGLIGGISGGFFFVIKNKKDYRIYMDFVAPIVPLAHAVGRLGCFFNGCCYGKVTDNFLGVHFPNLADNLKHYPTQIFESLFLIIFVLIIVFFVEKHKKYNGQLFIYYIFSYSVFRFFIEFIRGDAERGSLWFLSTSQWVSLLMILVLLFSHKYIKKEK